MMITPYHPPASLLYLGAFMRTRGPGGPSGLERTGMCRAKFKANATNPGLRHEPLTTTGYSSCEETSLCNSIENDLLLHLASTKGIQKRIVTRGTKQKNKTVPDTVDVSEHVQRWLQPRFFDFKCDDPSPASHAGSVTGLSRLEQVAPRREPVGVHALELVDRLAARRARARRRRAAPRPRGACELRGGRELRRARASSTRRCPHGGFVGQELREPGLHVLGVRASGPSGRFG